MPVILGGNTGIYLASLTPAVDPDAQAFITAAAITDPTQQAAINTLVVDLKGYNIWSKMKALYPFVGGTASAHKFNLKNPLDTDAAFRLVFNGGWTHSANGALPNGTNAYADTKLLSATSLSTNSSHLAAYSRTSTTNSSDCLMGNYEGDGIGAHRIHQDEPGFYRCENAQVYNNAGFNYSFHSGFFINSRITGSQYKTYRNSSIISTKNLSTISFASAVKKIFLAAVNGQFGVSGYSQRQIAFSSIGDGLTDTEAANFYTAVQAFQVALSRNI